LPCADRAPSRLAAAASPVQAELGFRYVRFHGLLSDDVGTIVKHNDELLYSFFNADQIVDFLLSIGMKPRSSN
jgi:beta-xylosidase